MRIAHPQQRRPMALALLLTVCPAWSLAQEVLLFDDFNGPALDTSTWGVATWNIGDRTQFGNQPGLLCQIDFPLPEPHR